MYAMLMRQVNEKHEWVIKRSCCPINGACRFERHDMRMLRKDDPDHNDEHTMQRP